MKQLITITELTELIEQNPALQLIDVRSIGEYNSGHVPRALNLPLEQVETRLADLGSGPVAILCQSGRRADIACKMLQAHHENLFVVEGGTNAWVQAGKPITSPVGSRWSLERQVRLIAGIMVLTGTVLSVSLSTSWVYLAMFVGAGLTFAGATNICGMALLLGKLPWNQASKCELKLEGKKS